MTFRGALVSRGMYMGVFIDQMTNDGCAPGALLNTTVQSHYFIWMCMVCETCIEPRCAWLAVWLRNHNAIAAAPLYILQDILR